MVAFPPWDWEVTAFILGWFIDCKNRLIVFLLGGQITQWFLSMALLLLTTPSGYRSNVENKFHMLKYVTHYLGTGTWTFFFFFHFSSAFNTMRPTLLGEKLTVRPQYMHTFKAACQTGPRWVAPGPHMGRVLSPFLLTLHCGLQSSPMTLPMLDGITGGN